MQLMEGKVWALLLFVSREERYMSDSEYEECEPICQIFAHSANQCESPKIRCESQIAKPDIQLLSIYFKATQVAGN